MAKRIVFSTATPNDQGGVIPNDVIDFSRFNKNPVILKEHVWSADPIGLWTDIRNIGGKFSGIPVFHALTEESKTTKALYDGGWIRAASIGGEAIWKENAAGQYALDKNGNRQCVRFILYEISIVTLPSNEDAVQEDAVELHAKFYDHSEVENISRQITTLSSKFNKMEPTEEKPETAKPIAVATQTPAAEKPARENDADREHITLKTSALPEFLQKIISGVKSGFAAPAPKDEPETKAPSIDAVKVEQPKPIGLKAEKEKSEMDKAKEKAAKAVQKAKEAKEKADADDATDDMKAAAKKAADEAESALKACEAAEEKYKAAMDEDDEEDDEPKEKPKKEKAKNSSSMKPELKSASEMREELKLAAKPEFRARVISMAGGKSFTELAADKKEGRAILNRVMTRDGGEKHLEDYAAVANALLADSKYSAIVEKARFMMNVNEASLGSFQANPKTRAGIPLKEIAAQLNAGHIEIMGRDNVMRQITTLSSSDNALASPALNAIEWLPLAIFKLFPTSSWKNEIPIFGAEATGNNTGIIWANIAADPAIYKGNQPSNPANYTYSDTAVALSLTPYWLQPMLWTPLTMHQLRYDQMGTGWAQAFAKWGAVMDDNLLYTLASTVPAGSILQSTGISGYQAVAQQLSISGVGPNQFYWNPSFAGNLLAPVLNDIISLEQIYANQNFQLEDQNAVLVMDPVMEAYFSRDPETKSLLTRWINDGGSEILKFKHTLLNQRSRVAIYDPASGQVKDPNGSIPSTAVSAGVGFVASQVGIGLGMLDVFMIQDPTNYGYKMSADIRIGIVPLRADFSGTALYTYGPGNV